ncbi:dihydrofolate reductase family protein [Oryzobacter telluris]|uniref:dihydrofolate reductase family protein n=1 Tax=Oryzobacter telluris TaxID=3149179 RepID=UPI00370D39AA
MARLRYTAICSLDGYVADAEGGFAWAAPSDELHQVVNDLEREVGTYLCGRRDYEVMKVWETMPGDVPGPEGEYARIWRAAEKVVHSTTLEDVDTARTRLVSTFDPVAVEALLADSTLDVSVGGPTLAAEAFRAGLVDEVHLFLHPVVVGGGLRALPDDVRLDLELLTTEVVGSVVHVHHRVRR